MNYFYYLTVSQQQRFLKIGRHDIIRYRRCWMHCPCNSSGRRVIFLEIPTFNHSNSTMQKRIPDFYIQSGYSHFVSRTYLFILELSVIGCLFRLSFQCHRIDRGGKEYRESTLGLHGRLDFLYLHHPFAVHQHRYFWRSNDCLQLARIIYCRSRQKHQMY